MILAGRGRPVFAGVWLLGRLEYFSECCDPNAFCLLILSENEQATC